MRLAWYAGASTALAGGVVFSAFNQRANFYSAMVHLSQSNLSIMILLNIVMFVYISFIYGLQRLCYGQLRPVEIEQLYEKAWFAVTETCLAMTIFREEIGAFFIVMFTALLTGKVWGWIGDGRVEVLEQQPPANPRLFHARLSISLVVSVIYDIWLLQYATRTVIQQARPNMTVMFLFEFAILLVCSVQTGLRYIVSLTEQSILKTQTRQGLEARRRQIREQRADILRRRESGEATEEEMNEPLPDENDVEEMDIEVPGWEAKGHWILVLDLCADFLKLGIYGAFFALILIFYGLPIHIMRDLFMTTRSFVKRLGALLRYRQAIKDLNRYPDATEEDLNRENTCIICREEMHPWNANDAARIERTRPKKLPCGHILHFGCLKSWLERQQVCPTCRRSVVIGAPEPGRRDANPPPFRAAGVVPGNPANLAPQPPAGNVPNNHQQPQQPNRPNVRMFDLGPIRLGFARGGAQDLQEMAQMMGVPAPPIPENNQAAVQNPVLPLQPGIVAPSNVEAIQAQLRAIEERIQTEAFSIRFAQQEAQVLRLLLQQLEMIRHAQAINLAGGQDAVGPQSFASGSGAQPQQAQHQSTVPDSQTSNHGQQPGATDSSSNPGVATTISQAPLGGLQQGGPSVHNLPPAVQSLSPVAGAGSVGLSHHTVAPNTTPIPAGSSDLPEGLVLPPGWSLLPLKRADGMPPAAPEIQRTGETTRAALAISEASTQSQSVPESKPAPTESTPEAGGSGTVTASQDQGDEEDGDTSSSEESEQSHDRGPTDSRGAMPSWGGSAQLFGDSGVGGNRQQQSRPADDKGKGRAVEVEDEDD
ncbi:hypothetical protein MCOR27_003953 [Pyricularia oryzae]|uniref:RING-type E3 ubiquitin transferase n=2 Tax=Pyricularia TaxID=48558 RepID=A0ABQ8NYK5_PYRGI|nr:hypothetical protein MCOR01_005985 [Pyricularia oryzae]KAI6303927.1 hypothetical protein MCOR33_000911 [Pyricularia grisea]KAH9435228.1 hypothetical protein MCOR02_004178 [Pyricularia oryzae]KAI6252152.1 hypothetical protein MCOR19_011229 [Pyricularia oryzae]KAI6282032.1 hypothetical protein MCOR27_003953 [Pyricularia oryzae]